MILLHSFTILASLENKTIIFNGEIYNHKELRKELLKNNKFTTNSDTEVLLTAYINYGEKCLSKLRGMFSFIVYDEISKIVFGARDTFGIKPLYYINNDDFIAFSSEYKALIKLLKNISVDHEALQNYLSFQYTPNYNTIINEIKEVPNGTYFTINDGSLKFYKYHDIKFSNEGVTENEIYDCVNDSIKHHMIANVEVGSFLSGGIDSTIVTALAAKINPKIKTFSVGFDVEEYNELTVAKKTARYLGVENISINVSEQDYILKPVDTVISEAVFTSASNVERFFQMLPEEIMVERAYSIGKKTTEALKKKNVMNICESEESTYESVVSLITKNKSVVSFIQLGYNGSQNK